MRVYLLELTGYNPVTEEEAVLRFSSDGFQTAPTDTPANTFYEPRLQVPFNFEVRVLSDGYTPGGASGGYGEAVLVNDSDGSLDFMADWAFDGREARFLVVEDDAPLADAVLMFTGTVVAVEATLEEVTLRVRDKATLFDVPLSPDLYAGNNVLPAGIEGTEDDLKGKSKEYGAGIVRNATPSLVNTSKAVYRFTNTQADGVVGVLTGGVAVTAGADYSTSAALLDEANAPAAGHYTTCLAEGLFRLVEPYDGVVTVTFRGDKTGGTYVNTVAGLVERVAVTRGGLSPGEIHAASFAAVAAASSAACGIFAEAGSSMTVGEALDWLVTGLFGGSWFFDCEGKLRVGRFEKPVGTETPVAEFTDDDVLHLERLVALDLKDGIPPYRVKVGYQRNWTVLGKGDLAGAALDAGWLAWAQEDFRYAVAEDADIQTVHPLAPEMVVETAIDSLADATAEAGRGLDTYKDGLSRYKFVVPIDSPALEGITPPVLFDVVRLTYDRFDLAGGKLFMVVGMVADWEEGEIEYEVLG